MTKEQYEAKKLALVEEIERAFDGVQREDGVTLHEAEVIDNYGSWYERRAARLKDAETRWQDIPIDLIRDCDSNLSFLDAKGFHYYFPAYLIWDLYFCDCEDEDFESNTLGVIDYKLLAREGAEADDYFLERFNFFDAEQRKVIAHYLQFSLERLNFLTEYENLESSFFDTSRKKYQWALDVYWGQFL